MKFSTFVLLLAVSSFALTQAPTPNNNLDQCIADVKHIIADVQLLQQYFHDKKFVKVIVTLDDISETYQNAQTVCNAITLPDILAFLDEHMSDELKVCVFDVVICGFGVKQLIEEGKAKNWDAFGQTLIAVAQQTNQTIQDCKAVKKFEFK